MKYLMIILLFSSVLHAQIFVPSATSVQNTKCTVTQSGLHFAGTNQTYRLYDAAHLAQIRILKCDTISINGLNFLTVVYSGIIRDSSGAANVLIDETALITPTQIKTVRSEVVDQSAPQRGDPVPTASTLGLVKKWGQSSSNPSVIMLEMTITENGKSVKPYYLKYNPKAQWFENIFTVN